MLIDNFYLVTDIIMPHDFQNGVVEKGRLGILDENDEGVFLGESNLVLALGELLRHMFMLDYHN